jgi:hypothetical protein
MVARVFPAVRGMFFSRSENETFAFDSKETLSKANGKVNNTPVTTCEPLEYTFVLLSRTE